MREKIALIVIFGAGTLATIMSIIRLHSIHIYTLAKDPFYDGIPVRTSSLNIVSSSYRVPPKV